MPMSEQVDRPELEAPAGLVDHLRLAQEPSRVVLLPYLQVLVAG